MTTFEFKERIKFIYTSAFLQTRGASLQKIKTGRRGSQKESSEYCVQLVQAIPIIPLRTSGHTN
jgi:hypothetical protein